MSISCVFAAYAQHVHAYPQTNPRAQSQRLPHPLVSPSPPLPHLRHRLNLRRPLLRRVRVFRVHIPLLIQVLSLETCLGTLYSQNMSQGWIAPVIRNTDDTIVIQLRPHRSP